MRAEGEVWPGTGEWTLRLTPRMMAADLAPEAVSIGSLEITALGWDMNPDDLTARAMAGYPGMIEFVSNGSHGGMDLTFDGPVPKEIVVEIEYRIKTKPRLVSQVRQVYQDLHLELARPAESGPSSYDASHCLPAFLSSKGEATLRGDWPWPKTLLSGPMKGADGRVWREIKEIISTTVVSPTKRDSQ